MRTVVFSWDEGASGETFQTTIRDATAQAAGTEAAKGGLAGRLRWAQALVMELQAQLEEEADGSKAVVGEPSGH